MTPSGIEAVPQPTALPRTPHYLSTPRQILLGALSNGRWDGIGGTCDTLGVGGMYKYRNLAWKTEGK